jgi:hypothetical protein
MPEKGQKRRESGEREKKRRTAKKHSFPAFAQGPQGITAVPPTASSVGPPEAPSQRTVGGRSVSLRGFRQTEQEKDGPLRFAQVKHALEALETLRIVLRGFVGGEGSRGGGTGREEDEDPV